jgi:hypothetical protein
LKTTRQKEHLFQKQVRFSSKKKERKKENSLGFKVPDLTKDVVPILYGVGSSKEATKSA